MADAPSVRRKTDSGGIPCPDRNLVAGYAEGRLLPGERRLVDAHMEGCAPCRDRVAAVRSSLGIDVAAPRTGGRGLLRLAAAGALAAAGLALAWFLPWGTRAPEPEGDAALVAAAEGLERESPEIFSGFRPLTRAERTARQGPLRGTGDAPRSPAGRILDALPAFRWEVPPGAGAWRFRLFRQRDGDLLLERDCDGPPLALPAGTPRLEEGIDYLWEAAADGPVARVEVRSTFSLATAEERRVLAAGEVAIERSAPAGTAEVLKAHWAIRKGFLLEAERILRARKENGPWDAAARETLDLLRETLGPAGGGR